MAVWTKTRDGDGSTTFQLLSWSHFFDFLEEEIFNPAAKARQSYIWRGQARADWSLSTTLDRALDSVGISTLPVNELEEISTRHLERFQYAARGRRGPSPMNPEENEWWALGQHFGLATPLLDWTRAPFAALYFAFEDTNDIPGMARTVYALDENAVLAKGAELQGGPSIEKGRVAAVEIVDPMYDENPRLVSQGGCFTRAPIGTPIEDWVARAFEGSSMPVLIRIEIPNTKRLPCLQALNRMNINHLSLFPDLSGASRSTNLILEFVHKNVRDNA